MRLSTQCVLQMVGVLGGASFGVFGYERDGVGGPGTPPSRSSCPQFSLGWGGSLPAATAASLVGTGPQEAREGDSVAESRPLTSARERGFHDPSYPGQEVVRGQLSPRIDPNEVSVVT